MSRFHRLHPDRPAHTPRAGTLSGKRGNGSHTALRPMTGAERRGAEVVRARGRTPYRRPSGENDLDAEAKRRLPERFLISTPGSRRSYRRGAAMYLMREVANRPFAGIGAAPRRARPPDRPITGGAGRATRCARARRRSTSRGRSAS